MILQELVKYYEALAERGEIALDGWSKEKVTILWNSIGRENLSKSFPSEWRRRMEKGKQ